MTFIIDVAGLKRSIISAVCIAPAMCNRCFTSSTAASGDGSIGVAGIVFGVLGHTWGWALLGGAVVYFAFSVLGLEIIARAEETGVLDEI